MFDCASAPRKRAPPGEPTASVSRWASRWDPHLRTQDKDRQKATNARRPAQRCQTIPRMACKQIRQAPKPRHASREQAQTAADNIPCCSSRRTLSAQLCRAAQFSSGESFSSALALNPTHRQDERGPRRTWRSREDRETRTRVATTSITSNMRGSANIARDMREGTHLHEGTTREQPGPARSPPEPALPLAPAPPEHNTETQTVKQEECGRASAAVYKRHVAQTREAHSRTVQSKHKETSKRSAPWADSRRAPEAPVGLPNPAAPCE